MNHPQPHEEAIIGQDNEHHPDLQDPENTGVIDAHNAQLPGVDTQNPGVMDIFEHGGNKHPPAVGHPKNTGVGPNNPDSANNVGPNNPNGANNATGDPEGLPRRLRPSGPKRDPTHLLGKGFEDEFIFLTAQMSAKKGLKIFGQPGADAIIAELQQLHYRRVVKPRFRSDMTTEEKRAALHYLMYLKQKRCGKIKARGCADGRKQRLWKSKDETSSPTVRTESVLVFQIN